VKKNHDGMYDYEEKAAVPARIGVAALIDSLNSRRGALR